MRPGTAQRYTGAGYWAVQIGFSALLAALGLFGGTYILLESGDPDPTGSAGTGEGAIVLLVGIVFLVLLVWLVTEFVSQSRQQRAVYAWAIMQEYVARDPGTRPLTPGRTVTGDIASMAIAAQARDGELNYEDVLRLQALRPEVPYPGDLEALRRRSASASASGSGSASQCSVNAEERERIRAEWAADDADALARLEAAGLTRPGAASTTVLAARAVGWAALAAFAVSVWLQSPDAATSVFLALAGLWCMLRLLSGILQDARTRRGRAIAEAWRSDAARAARGLPVPFAEFFGTPLGAWWRRLLTPMTLFGIFFLIGGLANVERGGERGVFLGMAGVAAVLLFASIGLRIVAAKRAAADRERLAAYRGRRAMDSGSGRSPRS